MVLSTKRLCGLADVHIYLRTPEPEEAHVLPSGLETAEVLSQCFLFKVELIKSVILSPTFRNLSLSFSLSLSFHTHTHSVSHFPEFSPHVYP